VEDKRVDVLIVGPQRLGARPGQLTNREPPRFDGISGLDLAARATSQAEKFGAMLMIGTGAQHRSVTAVRAEIGDGHDFAAR
jgi:hypothetical protein